MGLHDCLFGPLMAEPDGLPGFERSVTIHLNGGIVSEDILAAAFGGR